MSTPTLADALDTLCAEAVSRVTDPAIVGELDAIRGRLTGPLRVAIAGRIKAGKSTLLNALVGERMAPTDAGECTKVVTWFREGMSYGVEAVLTDGSTKQLRFDRADGALSYDLDTLTPARLDRIDVTWPASALRDMTLIDTPGLASAHEENSLRTQAFLEAGDTDASPADAVIYLMRHVHRLDVQFLDAFMDRSVAGTSPVNAVAVLSRADEIGAGRLDALDAARRIADRLRSDPQITSLCTALVPVAGLVAETAATLREDEVGALRSLAAMEQAELDALLVSVDRFRDPVRSPLTGELREQLLDRLGLFGVRFAIGALRDGRASSGPDLAALLRSVSGIDELRAVIHQRFLPRARSLQARAVLPSLRTISRRIAPSDPATAEWLAGELERLHASSGELAELRALHLLTSGEAKLSDEQAAEARRVILAAAPIERLGLDASSTREAVRDAALEGIARWRTAGEHPLASPTTREVAETIAHAYEAIYITSV